MPRMPARPGPRLLLGLLGRRAATTRGNLRVRGLTAHVTIARDRWGIPHVDTATERDAWFGLGFCHGQDRAFQLELLARAGRGTLSELLGRATVPIDRLSRTLGFRRVAEAQLAVLDDDVRGGLEAYVAGIDAAADVTPVPHELVLLRSRRRTRWEAADVLAFLGLQSLALAGNWDTELARLAILLADGPDALAAVEPRYGPWLPVTVPVGEAAGEALGRLGEDMARLRDLVGGGGASNAWAVAGSRSATGAPLLANDPHLGPSRPGAVVPRPPPHAGVVDRGRLVRRRAGVPERPQRHGCVGHHRGLHRLRRPLLGGTAGGRQVRARSRMGRNRSRRARNGSASVARRTSCSRSSARRAGRS